MEHTKFIEFRQPRSGASLFIRILCEIHGPEESIQSCKSVISAGFGCAFAKFTVAKAGSGFLSHAQCKSSFLWFCLTTGYPILWFITIFSWPGNLGLNTLFSAPNGHVLDRYTSPKSSQARMKMRTQRGAHIYGIEHDGANTRPSMMGFWARLFFSGTSFLWTFHDICMNIYKEKKMMNIFKRPH